MSTVRQRVRIACGTDLPLGWSPRPSSTTDLELEYAGGVSYVRPRLTVTVVPARAEVASGVPHDPAGRGPAAPHGVPEIDLDPGAVGLLARAPENACSAGHLEQPGAVRTLTGWAAPSEFLDSKGELTLRTVVSTERWPHPVWRRGVLEQAVYLHGDVAMAHDRYRFSSPTHTVYADLHCDLTELTDVEDDVAAIVATLVEVVG